MQGVGFRPFVFGVAQRLGLAGFVGNDTEGVFIEAEGSPAALEMLFAALAGEAPPLSRVDAVTARPLAPCGETGFGIVASRALGERVVPIAPDAATCGDCLREMADPTDRRFGYPFINCTNCGPRFTIVRSTPYDRPLTTMADFVMCADCAGEYADPADRRFHAQPVCCPACGPRLVLVDSSGRQLAGDPVAGALDLLGQGSILAVKGLGGYHLATDATDEAAVAALRSRKHREERPFAVLVADLEAARRLVEISPAEEALLASTARPIVLLRRRPGSGVAADVAPNSPFLGLLLPYTPLHHLLSRGAAGPLVLTSGNVSDEPIAYLDGDARERLSPIADAFLTHDRAIHTRVDDSVARVVQGRALLIRRSRGYVPAPVPVPWAFPRPVLACGPELKNTFALGRGRAVFLSHHIGDLENYETLRSYTDGIAHFQQLFDIRPEVVAYDLHPEYLSTKYALDVPDVRLVGVQHHHAHIVSCLADNGVDGPVIGVAFDGLGWGEDATLWGGEFLLADRAAFQRVAHFATVPLPGGAMAVRQPWRMAAAHLDAAYGGSPPADFAVTARHGRQWADVLAAAAAGVNSPLTSSVGRLFDAVSAMLGVRDTAGYEGQAAIELEHLVDPAERGAYPAGLIDGSPLQISGGDLIRAVAEDLLVAVPAPVIAGRFHNGVIRTVVDVCSRLRRDLGVETVALSGGVFQNLVLVQGCTRSLEADGFRVLTHSRVPPNDGGISLGQAVVAAARSG